MGILARAAPVLWFIGGVALCIAVYVAVKLKVAYTAHKKKQKKDKQPAQTGKHMGAMDRILIVLGVFLLCFIVGMIVIFIQKDSIPDTLVQCVFGACGLEGGVMGWIKTTKERRQDRRWARQDAREDARAAGNAYEEMEN